MARLLIIYTLFITGCSTEASGNHIVGAVEFCKTHGGVARLWSDMWQWNTQCVDGTRKNDVGESK